MARGHLYFLIVNNEGIKNRLACTGKLPRCNLGTVLSKINSLLYVGFALSPVIFNFALEYHITVVEEKIRRDWY